MKKLQAGEIASLNLVEEKQSHYIMSNGNEQVYIDKESSQPSLSLDQIYSVFIYKTSPRLFGSLKLPNVRLDTFDWVEVTKIQSDLGVFVDIGTNVDVLVSKDDLPIFQSVWPAVSDQLYVILDHDKKGRLLAKPVSEMDFEGTWDQASETLLDKEINGRIFRTDKEGAVMISDQGYRGFIHHKERKEEPRLGEWVTGRVIAVKEDGTLNVSLRPRKKEARISDAEMIEQYLYNHNGQMPFTDKTDPETIYQHFRISKSAFKRALGKLMKEGKVQQQGGKTTRL